MSFWKKFASILAEIFTTQKRTAVSERSKPVKPTETPEPTPIDTGDKYALIIGINKYMVPNSDLNGCVNDAEDVWNMITKNYGFKPDNVRMLTDFRATKQAILERLEWLVSTLKSGDTGFVHYSGHGSQVRDRNGDELNDHLDEILCPTDLNWDDPLTDDLLSQFFKRIPEGAFVTFICDSCHSGSMTRGIQKMSNPHEWVSKFLSPPVDVRMRGEGRNLEVRTIGRRGIDSSENEDIHIIEQRHLLLSGCMDNQTSADAFVGGRWGGALTQNFLKLLSSNKKKSWCEIHELLMDDIKKQGYSQVPQLTGPTSVLEKSPLS